MPAATWPALAPPYLQTQVDLVSNLLIINTVLHRQHISNP